MPRGQKPQYDVFVSREVERGKNFYTRVGSGWEVAKGGISVRLDALPVNGQLVIFPAKDPE